VCQSSCLASTHHPAHTKKTNRVAIQTETEASTPAPSCIPMRILDQHPKRLNKPISVHGNRQSSSSRTHSHPSSCVHRQNKQPSHVLQVALWRYSFQCTAVLLAPPPPVVPPRLPHFHSHLLPHQHPIWPTIQPSVCTEFTESTGKRSGARGECHWQHACSLQASRCGNQ
jgi:hypothetical protein